MPKLLPGINIIYGLDGQNENTIRHNLDNFNIVMWISLDKGVYINVTTDNADSLIKYLYERYPY